MILSLHIPPDDLAMIREALAGAAAQRRRAAEKAAAEVTANPPEGQDPRTPALLIMRTLGEAGRLEAVAAQCTPANLATAGIHAQAPAPVSAAADGPPVLPAFGPTADPDEPLSPEAAATVATLAGGNIAAVADVAAKVAKASAAGLNIPHDPNELEDDDLELQIGADPS